MVKPLRNYLLVSTLLRFCAVIQNQEQLLCVPYLRDKAPGTLQFGRALGPEAYIRQALIQGHVLVLKKHLDAPIPPALIQDRRFFKTRRSIATVRYQYVCIYRFITCTTRDITGRQRMLFTHVHSTKI